jgi:ketosteroid isomerase-like protein
LVCGDWAVVEHNGHAVTKKGEDYKMEFCWVCRFESDKIVEVRMYMDTALGKKTIEENE